MATGNILNFGLLECVGRSNNKTYMGSRKSGDFPHHLKYENYKEIKIVNTQPYASTNNLTPLQWIEYENQGFKCYIMKDFIYSYTSKKAVQKLAGKYTIDGKRYLLAFMPGEFWSGLPQSVMNHFNNSMRVISSDEIGFVGDSKQIVTRFTKYQEGVYYASYIAIDNTPQTDPCGFLPVLIPIDDADGTYTKTQFGLIKVKNNDGTTEVFGNAQYPNSDALVFTSFDMDNYIAGGDVTIIDEAGYSGKTPLTWLETTYGGKRCFVYPGAFFRWGCMNDVNGFSKKVIIKGTQYTMKPMPVDFWIKNDKMLNEILDKDEINLSAIGSYMTTTPINSEYHYSFDKRYELRQAKYDAFGSSSHRWVITLVQDTNDPPTISGRDSDLGVKESPFSITFSVNDLDPTQTLTVTETLNGTKVRSFTATRKVNYLSNITQTMLDSIAPGSTCVYKISVTDGIDTAVRVYSFTKKIVYPQINVGTNIYDLGVKDEPFEKVYFISHNLSNNYVVTEMLNDKVLRVRNLTYEPLHDFVVGSDDFFALEDGSVNTLTIKVECAGLTAEKSMIFTKGHNNVHISGKDTDLGTKTSPFEIEFWTYLAHSGFFESDYEASDFKIDVSVTLNDKIFYTTTLNELQHCVVNISQYMLNDLETNSKNVVRIVAKYKNYTAERMYTFYKGSTAPTISGSNGSLGNKSKPFNISYKVTNANKDQTISITESLNGAITRSFELTGQTTINSVCHVNANLFNTIEPDRLNTLIITASNGVQTVTRTYTFTRVNQAPTIVYNGETSLGQLEEKPTIMYKVTDSESDVVTITEILNGEVLNSFTANSNTDYVIDFLEEDWLSCSTGENVIEIVAADDFGSDSILIDFSRKEEIVQIELRTPIEANNTITKILVVPQWDIENATGTIEVCNNALDEEPVWEDATEANLAMQTYEFTNTEIVNGPAINIRLTLDKNDDYDGRVTIYGFNVVYHTKGSDE